METGPVELVQFSRALQWLGDGWLGWLAVGLIAGLLVRLMTFSAKSVGLLSACALGIAGAALGWYAAQYFGLALGAAIGGYVAGMLNVTNTALVWVIAILAAIVLLFLWEAVRGKKARVA